jgi:hypothetical protein
MIAIVALCRDKARDQRSSACRSKPAGSHDLSKLGSSGRTEMTDSDCRAGLDGHCSRPGPLVWQELTIALDGLEPAPIAG